MKCLCLFIIMKTSILSIIIQLAISLTLQAQEMIQVNLHSSTRGGQKYIQVTSDSMSFNLLGDTQTFEIDMAEWEELKNLVNDIDFKSISNYTSNSSGRSRDAAWHSKLTIKTLTNTYNSNHFDDAEAPDQLLPVVRYLLELDKKYNTETKRIY